MSSTDITRLLKQWSGGSQEALDQLIPLVHDELRSIAARHLAREWRADRLQTTAVVNEAYLKLIDQREADWQNRGHFFAIASKLMRRILVDHARHALRDKRGAGVVHLTLDNAASVSADSPVDRVELLMLDTALRRLETLDATQAKVVELRFFGGLTVEETATALGTSEATVKREWAIAKSWLHRELTRGDQKPS